MSSSAPASMDSINIAKELKFRMKTVEFHKANITRKLGVRTTSDLIRVALSSGMTAL